MTPSSPWLRFFAGLLAAAIAIRLAVEIVRPVLVSIVAIVALAGVIVLIRSWRNSRW